MYWPLDNYPDLLACDLLVKETLLFKPNWWITQMKGSSVLVCQSKDTSPALKAKPATVLSCELKKGNSLIRYWPRKVLGLFCSLECACVTKKNTLNSKLQNLGVDLRFSLGWRYHLEFSFRLIWTKIVCKCCEFHTFATGLLCKRLTLLQSKLIFIVLGWNSLEFSDVWDTMALSCLVPAQSLSLVFFVIVAQILSH